MKVRDAFETQAAMAEFFEVTQPTVNRWLNRAKQLPAEHVLRAEARIGIPRHYLRPDIYPPDLPPGPAFLAVDEGTGRVCFQMGAVSKGEAKP